MFLRKIKKEDDKLFLCYLSCILSLLASSVLSFCMEQKTSAAISWQSSTNGNIDITFYYTLAHNVTIYDLKTQFIPNLQAQIPNSRVLHHHNLTLELIPLYCMMKARNRNFSGFLPSFEEHKHYELTIINNKRKSIDPIDDPSLEVDDIQEPIEKKRKQ
jgi:hypothetical protein